MARLPRYTELEDEEGVEFEYDDFPREDIPPPTPELPPPAEPTTVQLPDGMFDSLVGELRENRMPAPDQPRVLIRLDATVDRDEEGLMTGFSITPVYRG